MAGRILVGGADSLAWASRNGGLSVVLGDDSNTLPAGYSIGSPMPMYEALGMFTGEGLFPHFGTTMVAAASDLPGVDAFASSSPDNIVLVNKSGSAQNTMIRVNTDSPSSVAIWQIDQTGQTPSAPTKVATAVSDNGSFDISLPAYSVATLVITSPGPGSQYVRGIDAQTGRCLDSNSAGSTYTLPCNGGNYQNWNL